MVLISFWLKHVVCIHRLRHCQLLDHLALMPKSLYDHELSVVWCWCRYRLASSVDSCPTHRLDHRNFIFSKYLHISGSWTNTQRSSLLLLSDLHKIPLDMNHCTTVDQISFHLVTRYTVILFIQLENAIGFGHCGTSQ